MWSSWTVEQSRDPKVFSKWEQKGGQFATKKISHFPYIDRILWRRKSIIFMVEKLKRSSVYTYLGCMHIETLSGNIVLYPTTSVASRLDNLSNKSNNKNTPSSSNTSSLAFAHSIHIACSKRNERNCSNNKNQQQQHSLASATTCLSLEIIE